MFSELCSPWPKLLACSLGVCVLTAGLASARTRPAEAELPSFSALPVIQPLPDPLTMLDGARVTTPEQWERQRRPELKRLFQHYMYGYFPDAPTRVRAKVDREDRQALGGKATLREVSVFHGPEGTPPIHLLTVTPNSRRGRVPAFLGLSFGGNQTALHDPKIRISEAWTRNAPPQVVNNRATEASRGSQVNVWNIEQSIDRGYAVAVFNYGDVAPDEPKLAQEALARLRKPGAPKGSADLGAIGAWAWGMQRCLDYLRTDPAIDKSRIAAVGHSRNGKAALLAAAFDERFALAIPLQAGCGGTAPSRGKIGESVKQINDRFPHWFNDHFKEFNDAPQRLPFDQHCLVALMAPRPVLFPNASEDTWANPDGQFDMLEASDPVYRLLGVEGLKATAMPPLGKLVNTRLGYFIRPGKHSMTSEDWTAFLDYTDQHFGMRRAERK
ncbi:MAG: acetylxylan esterase [Actinomycetota bacterium]